MARRSKKSEPETLRKQLLALIADFEHKLLENSLREQVLSLVPANHLLRDLGSSLLNEENCNSARDRILAYLLKYPKTIIHGDELMVVAGISEYARRIRELRVQFGWSVLSGTTVKEMIEQEEITLQELQITSISASKPTFMLWWQRIRIEKLRFVGMKQTFFAAAKSQRKIKSFPILEKM
ncbi:hypothetical protein [Enterobacter hormaechei]|uniref:hypothetical protein n=1 Tax=Enterobacter hormaechei TaxID=158836 RepID=UPI0021ADA6B1|nr:hypothetical protein [Enterobacter hormaechei]